MSPERSAQSAATTDGPPDTVMMAMRGAFGRIGPAIARASIASKNSSVSSVSTAPACRQAAWKTAAGPASAPVCEAAARRPASELPPLRTTTGLRPAARAAAATKRRPSGTCSMKQAMSVVASSSTR